MTPPLLSLCFPTYKRAPLLDGALRAVLGQITPDLCESVEVVVLDNASPDDTPRVVERAQADFPRVLVRSIRRPENIGADANFCDAITQAQGEFVYLLSDDDVLLPGAVAMLARLIAVHPDVDAFAVNAHSFVDSPDEETDPVFNIRQDTVFRGRDEALGFLSTHVTFLSCIAFRRENLAGKDYSDMVGLLLIQAFFFVDALAPGRGLYAIQQPLLAQRADNNQDFNFFQVFVTNFDRVLRYAEQAGYSPHTIRGLRARTLRFAVYVIGVFKTKGAIGTIRPDYRDGLRRLWRVYGPHPILLFVIVPMMLTPRPVYGLLFGRTYAAYRRWKAAVGTVTP